MRNYILGLFALFISINSYSQTVRWTLDACIKQATDNNISVKQSEQNIKLSDIDKKKAMFTLAPSLNASASHSWTVGLNQDVTTGLYSNQTNQYTSMGFGFGLDLYKGLQNQNQIRKANLNVVLSKYQMTKMQEDISLNVANAFLQVLSNKETLKTQQQQTSLNESQLKRTEELVNAGIVPKGDMLDMKATLASNKQKMITYENTLLISKLSLAQLLQISDLLNFDIVDEILITNNNSILSQTPDSVYAKAKEIRTEIQIAKTNLEISKKELSIARGVYQPTLKGFYNIDTRVSYADSYDYATGQYVSALPPFDQLSKNKGQSFGVQLNIPVFNGFSARNSVERSKVNYEKSKLSLEQDALDLQKNVFTAFSDATGALNAYESALTALEARQEAFDYSKEKYAVGLMNSVDFNQSQTLFTQAQSEVIRTKYDYIFKIKILEFYFGIPIGAQ